MASASTLKSTRLLSVERSDWSTRRRNDDECRRVPSLRESPLAARAHASSDDVVLSRLATARDTAKVSGLNRMRREQCCPGTGEYYLMSEIFLPFTVFDTGYHAFIRHVVASAPMFISVLFVFVTEPLHVQIIQTESIRRTRSVSKLRDYNVQNVAANFFLTLQAPRAHARLRRATTFLRRFLSLFSFLESIVFDEVSTPASLFDVSRAGRIPNCRKTTRHVTDNDLSKNDCKRTRPLKTASHFLSSATPCPISFAQTAEPKRTFS